jgi:hypothetical protein
MRQVRGTVEPGQREVHLAVTLFRRGRLLVAHGEGTVHHLCGVISGCFGKWVKWLPDGRSLEKERGWWLAAAKPRHESEVDHVADVTAYQT